MNTTKLNDGGPAFPRPGFTAEQTESQEGMTLRAYIAIHAPAEVPDWFTPAMTPLPNRPAKAEFCDGCKADGDCLKTEDCLLAQEWQKQTAAVRERNKIEKLIAWRLFYADNMIANLESLTPAATPIFPKELIPSVKAAFHVIIDMIDAPHHVTELKVNVRKQAELSLKLIEAAETCAGE